MRNRTLASGINKPTVLVLCTGNSCRSQMAEGLWNSLSHGDWHCWSAGSEPAGYVHPLAVEVMKERGIDLSKNVSKHLDDVSAESFEYAITVCDHAEKTCPVISNARQRLHWPFPDPAEATGTLEEKLETFRDVRDAIDHQIRDFLASWEPSCGD